MEILNYEEGNIVQEYGDAGYPEDMRPYIARFVKLGYNAMDAFLWLQEARDIDLELE